MEYTAVYKNNGNLAHMTSDYKTKKDFEQDIRCNGLIPIAILTQKQISAIKNNEFDVWKFTRLDFDYVKQCL